jgi:hypothetical protein
LRPTLAVRFNEPIDPTSWTSHGIVVQAPDGTSVAGSYAVDADRLGGSFVPNADLVPGRAYAVSLGSAADVAGNTAIGVAPWTVLPVIPARLSLAVNPTVIVAGGSTALAGNYRGGSPVPPMTIAARRASEALFGQPFQIVANADGTFQLGLRPSGTTTFRVVAAGSNTVADATADVRVIVRRKITLAVSGGTASGSRAGQTVQVTARVTPAGSGVSVSFRLYRWDSRLRTYRYAGSWGRGTDPDGTASYRWTPGAGIYRWRVSVAPTIDYANNISSFVPWKVSR